MINIKPIMVMCNEDHLRLRTTNNWVPCSRLDSRWWENSTVFLENLLNSSSIIPLPKCLVRIPSKPALRCIPYSFPVISPPCFDAAGYTISILSMLKSLFRLTRTLICSPVAAYTGILKESTSSSLINPCNQWLIFYDFDCYLKMIGFISTI